MDYEINLEIRGFFKIFLKKNSESIQNKRLRFVLWRFIIDVKAHYY